jgi:hypothetical protein
LYIKTGASTWKAVNAAYIKTGASTWKEFFRPFALSLSGHSITDNVSIAALHINADGTVDEFRTMSGTQQIDSATDWIIPNSASSENTFEAKWTATGDQPNWVTSGWTTGTWKDVPGTGYLLVGNNQPGTGDRTSTVNVTIRKKDTASTETSGVYNITVVVV